MTALERRFDHLMMAECLRLAKKGMRRVSPNPMVGAVLVKGGTILARGHHKAFGGPHAEVACLRNYGRSADGTTLYVNLEPCAHYGKTPPCTDLIIRSGIREVVVGMEDPNPLVAGRGVRRLRRSGIKVRVGVLQREARELNRKYIKYITSNLPYVHVKIAQSLDGMIAPAGGGRGWITSASARALVHSWRAEYDAVLVGSGTLNADDPSLTVRLVEGENPDVVILDGRLRAPDSARVFSKTSSRRVIVCVARNAAARHRAKVRRLQARGVTVLEIPGHNGRLHLREVLRALSWLDISSVLVEGGAEVFREFVHGGFFDELSIIIAPIIMGAGVPAFDLSRYPFGRAKVPAQVTRLSVVQVGPDILLHSYKGR